MADIEITPHKEGSFIVPGIPIATSSEQQIENSIGTVAPLIFNAWYVIAVSKNVDRTLRGIKALGQPLVYYRAENGQPVVLDDRCAHRRFPLSKGRLKGDTIECGYHGFTYAATGRCVWAPGVPLSQDGDRKLGFGVRAYPCAERGNWLWVWMGKPELADPAKIPLPEFGLDKYQVMYGYKLSNANYMFLLENLLDLSHIHFLHQAQDRAYASEAPQDAPAPENGVAWMKVAERTETGLLASFCGDDATRLVRQEDTSALYGPSLCVGTQRRMALPGDPTPVKLESFIVAHAVTPADERNTHQFFFNAFSDPVTTANPDELVKFTEDVVFDQDAQAVRDMQANVDQDTRPGRVEFSMIWDKYGIKMRKILKEMKERELKAL